jgi:hypothetical protein
MLAKLGAAADKRPRIPTKMKLGMAKKAKQREAVALEEAIAAGMVKAKGRGKKARALKGTTADVLFTQLLGMYFRGGGRCPDCVCLDKWWWRRGGGGRCLLQA